MSRESDQVLLDYYKTHRWTEKALELVDWTHLEIFLKRRHLIEHCNIIQLMHDWQHTGNQQKKFQNSRAHTSGDQYSDRPSPQDHNQIGDCFFECGCEETPFHYMQCRSDILATARTKGRERLDRDLYKMQTAPSLREAILQGIFCWEDGTEYDLDHESNKFLFNEGHTQLLQSQNSIGWDKFLKGYVAKEWGIIQEQYYTHANLPRTRKHTRKNWVVHLLTSLHSYRNSIWTIRNQIVHGGKTSDQREYTRKKMQQIVGRLYRKDRSAIPQRERNVFNLPLKLRKKQGNHQLELWIKRTKLLFETYTDVPIRNDQQRNITHWLQEWGHQPKEITMSNMILDYHTKEDSQRDIVSIDEEDDGEARTKFSQMNITNWLKSWGSNNDGQDITNQSTQSNRDVRSLTNTLD
jgi:hypothetical protein